LSATSKADHSLINSADDAYYINKDGKHPFAISVPGLEYIPANEGILINEHYPKFTDWVTSGGEKNKDWWKYPVE
jgi:LruC domain-containing protein